MLQCRYSYCLGCRSSVTTTISSSESSVDGSVNSTYFSFLNYSTPTPEQRSVAVGYTIGNSSSQLASKSSGIEVKVGAVVPTIVMVWVALVALPHASVVGTYE